MTCEHVESLEVDVLIVWDRCSDTEGSNTGTAVSVSISPEESWEEPLPDPLSFCSLMLTFYVDPVRCGYVHSDSVLVVASLKASLRAGCWRHRARSCRSMSLTAPFCQEPGAIGAQEDQWVAEDLEEQIVANSGGFMPEVQRIQTIRRTPNTERALE